MNIMDALKEVYKIYDKIDETPDVSSEDFKVRLAYANNAISKWEKMSGTDWKELYDEIEDTLSIDGTFALPDDFFRPTTFLQVDSVPYAYVRPERVHMEVEYDDSREIYTIDRGYIDVFPNPGAEDFTLGYRKRATKFSTGNEVTELEMSDPYYLINDVVAQLYLDDEDNNLANVFMQVANQKLEAMKLSNEIEPFYQEEEEDFNFYGFGR